MKKFEALQKIFQLSEYVKLEAKKSHENYHHPLKNNLTKSNNRILGLIEREGPMNQRAMSRYLSISPQAVSEAVKKLEIEQLVEKDNDNKIILTESGLEYAIAFKKVVVAHAEVLLKDFEEKELQAVIDFAIKLLPKEDNND